MKALCVASSNPGKLKEIQKILDNLSTILHAQADFGIKPAPETGSTFVENAIIKAKHAAKLSGLPTIADDSGLCIEILNQDPGVNSSHYAGHESTVEDNIKKIITNLLPHKGSPIKARLVTVICFMDGPTDLTPLLITETLEGEILHAQRGIMRGYDSIFLLPELKKTLGELSIDEKNQISPRGRAITILHQYFQNKYFLKAK